MSNYKTDKVPYPPYRKNEIDPRLLSLAAANMFSGYNSSPRQAMFFKQLGQILVTEGAEPRILQTGVEREMGKHTFSKTFKNNSYIIATVQKYPRNYGYNQIGHSPSTTVIYENSDDPNLEVGVMYLEDYFSMHHFFGFEYKNTPHMDKVRAGSRIGAGTTVSNSPAVFDNGDYAYGVNANVLMCSHPAVAEDGVVISESLANKLTVTLFEEREFEFGRDKFPLNIYGDENEYKIFPDIGQKVRDDGIIRALRDYQPELAPCDLSVKAVQRVTDFDQAQYVPPDAVVVDVTITRGSNQTNVMFTEMETQVERYHERHMAYYNEIRSTYKKLKKQHGDNLHISREFHRLLVEAEALTQGNAKLTQT